MTELELIIACNQAIEEEESKKTDARTVFEIANALGVHTSTVNRKLRGLINSGKIEQVWVKREDMMGRVVRVPAYRVPPGANPGEG